MAPRAREVASPSRCRLIRPVLLLLAVLASPWLRADSDPAADARLAFRTFTDRDGLPQNSIMAVARDIAGRLWVGTQDGAAFYDGRRWTAVNMPGESGSNY